MNSLVQSKRIREDGGEVKNHEWVQKGVAKTPAWGMCLACDFMVVQELGNVGPGWRGLGKAFVLLIDPNLIHGEKQVLKDLRTILGGRNRWPYSPECFLGVLFAKHPLEGLCLAQEQS